MTDTVLYSSASTGAVLTSTQQGPSGAIAAPTGTGFVHVTSGAIDGAARAVNLASNGANGDVTGTLALANFDHTGSAYNVLQMNNTGSAAVWGPLALAASGAVTGALTAANGGTGLTSPGTSGYVLTSNGTAWVSQALPAAGITALTQDVTASGSGSVAATVVAAQAGLISFAASTGLVTWATGATGPGLTQATAGSGVTPVGITITPQAPNAGSGTTASGTPGSFTVALASPVSSGTEAFLKVYRGGTYEAAIGALSSNSFGGLWFMPTAGTETIATAALFGTSSITFLSANTGIYSYIGGSPGPFCANIDGLQVNGASTFAFGGGVGVLGIAKAGTNPSSSISTGGVLYADSSSGALCMYPAGVTAAQLTVASTTVYAANAFQAGGNVAVGGGGSGPSGGGVGVIALNNAGTQPTAASVSGGVALSASGGGFVITDASATVTTFTSGTVTCNGAFAISPNTVSSGSSYLMTVHGGDTSLNSGTGGGLTLRGGNATGTTTTGGAAILESGTGTTGNGTLTLSSGNGTTYGSLGVVSSGKTPGTLVLNGPAATQTQAVGGGGKTTLNVSTGSWIFLPVTVNGVTTGQIPICI